MKPSVKAYWEDLTVQLRLAGMDGAEIGAVLEESKDHLAASGEHPADAFGPAADYAAGLAGSHRPQAGRGLDLTRGDLLAAAAQLGAWWVLISGIVALAQSEAVELRPGVVVGWGVLTVGFAWPVWPAVRAFTIQRQGLVVPLVAMMSVVAISVGLGVIWNEPVLARVPPLPAILLALVVIAGCWWRAWRQRDPVQRPVVRPPGSRSAE